MGLAAIDEVFSFSGADGLAAATAGILRGVPSGGRERAVLLTARTGESGGAELGQTAGVWSLAVPFRDGVARFRKQTREIILTGGERVGFDDSGSVGLLSATLRDDEVFQNSFFQLASHVTGAMAGVENERPVRFDLLDALSNPGSRLPGQAPVFADKGKKPGKSGWVGVEVVDFITCMKDCEEDADPWEVWVHAYCLLKCGIKAGTGGGPLFQ